MGIKEDKVVFFLRMEGGFNGVALIKIDVLVHSRLQWFYINTVTQNDESLLSLFNATREMKFSS